MSRIVRMLGTLWDALREACGEDDYTRHRTRALAEGNAPLSAREFYLLKLQQKYSRPCRCC